MLKKYTFMVLLLSASATLTFGTLGIGASAAPSCAYCNYLFEQCLNGNNPSTCYSRFVSCSRRAGGLCHLM